VQGGGTSALFGGGGVLAGIESIFGDVANSNSPLYNSPAGFLSTAIKSVNTYNNFKEIKNKGADGIARELGQIISSPAAISGIVSRVGGIAGSIFPKNIPSGDSIIASAKKFFG
jgi:hypothetical protein